MSSSAVDVVIPTFERHGVLLETIERMLALEPPPARIIVVDQSSRHPPEVQARLEELDRRGSIRWLRAPRPSIPGAMNLGLRSSVGDIVLFVDDDVVPLPDLVARHAAAHAEPGVAVVAGQVLQPGERPEALAGSAFRFRSSLRQPVEEVIGCNFSVKRAAALDCGGFDENFVHVAYRFEIEFCDRIRRRGGAIVFEPAASLQHLRAPAGGTRAYGSHLRTVRPSHSVGEYYYLLHAPLSPRRLGALLQRPWKAVATRHHLARPWWIVPTLCAELLGFLWALGLVARGPRLVESAPAARGPA